METDTLLLFSVVTLGKEDQSTEVHRREDQETRLSGGGSPELGLGQEDKRERIRQ